MTDIVTSLIVEENLETFSLIWLDASVNDTQENIDAQHQLRTSINFLKIFEDADKCEQYIRSVPKDDRIVFIVSGRFGEIIVPRIHSLRQVSAIYVYCKDKKRNELWSNQFKKVKGVIVLLDELISQIRSDQARRNRNRVDEPLPMNFSNTNNNKHEQSTSDLSGQFIQSQLLIDCLVRMKPTSNEKNDFISLCQQYYKGNTAELSLLNEFEKFYSSERALWWYTREAFLYRLVNKALRILNVDLLFLCRFFIRDIQKQLEQRQCSSFVHLYRCQLMSIEEIQLLQKSIGKYVAMNSYLSTSVNRRQALSFLDYSSDFELVLFEIDADPQLKGIKPFSNITSLSYFPEEEEILFMLGSIFRIISINRDEDELWTIRMVLVGDEHQESNLIINQMKNEYTEQETNIITYGNILRDMSKLNEAEKYYRRFLDQSSKNSQDIANCYYSLGTVACAKGKYDESLQWHLDALSIKMDKLSSHDPNIALSYNCIAIVYRKKNDHRQALKSYEKSLKIWEKSFGENHPKVAMCLNNIGAVYEDQKDYSKALEYYEMALDIAKKHVPIDHRALSAVHNNIGNIYCMLNNYDHALEHYNEAFRIKSKFLSNQHPSLATALRSIGIVYEKKGLIQKAQKYFKQAADIDSLT
ncbi:unnamed protein product [Rotaria sp. Silwood2]|nr:unnamed protein product [Rotaria sp. Silwood2]CAF4036827.1 unnamed protein product [Rotaria sp. Silwood2]